MSCRPGLLRVPSWPASCSAALLSLLVATIVATPLASAQEAATESPRTTPLPPNESIAAMRIPEGLDVQLVACEPDVVDPVAIRFDESGRMWVVEMRDYPHGPAPGEPPRSRIKVLEDHDGDGRFETVTVYVDSLLFVTGVQPWKGGVFVTLAGRVAYLKDEDGDGRADRDETWYTGFAEENSQLRANHPTLSIDGHVYIANGLRGGVVVDRRREGVEPLPISGMDFRFDPRGATAEAMTGIGQFGLTFDDAGRRFVCSNRNPLREILIENEYLRRNPRAAIPAAIHDVAAWGEDSRLFPLSRAWTTSTLHAGQFTAACGVQIYRGTRLPDDLRGAALTCDPTGNLVHLERLVVDGPTFRGVPWADDREFLASTDEWFRPVNLENGPDGALYIVDMCRAVIEHPQFMPDELKERGDLVWGNDAGRIYRLVRSTDVTSAAPARAEALGGLDAAGLVRLLDHPNAWQHETAQRLLLERQDEGAVASLRELLRSGTPLGRGRALWALRHLGALDEPTLIDALRDNHPEVREQALRLAGLWRKRPAVRAAVAALAQDESARLRFLVALTLAPIEETEVDALAAIGRRADDVWSQRAVLIASGDRAGQVLQRIATPTPALQGLLSELAGNGPEAPAQELLQHLQKSLLAAGDGGGEALALAGLDGLTAGLARCQSDLRSLAGKEPSRRELLEQTAAHIAAIAARPAAQRDASADALALRLLGRLRAGQSLLTELARSEPDATRRGRAMEALAQLPDLAPWPPLLDLFPKETPAIRRVLLDAVLARPDRAALLLERLESGAISLSELDPTRTQRLAGLGDAGQKARVAKLLAASVPEDRQLVLERYRPALELAADPRRGQEVFRKNCATCHRVAGIGVDVAPDIADSRTKLPLQILTDVLQPNRAIDSNYLNYVVTTADGEQISGILSAETETSVTLRQPENKTVVLLRSDIERIQSTGRSLMPVGLEKNIPPQEMADLVSFIKNWRYLDGRTPLGGAP